MLTALGRLGRGALAVPLALAAAAPPFLPAPLLRRAATLRLTTAVPQALALGCRSAAAIIAAKKAPWTIYCPPLVPQGDVNEVYSSGLGQSAQAGYRIIVFSAVRVQHWGLVVGQAETLRALVEPPGARAPTPSEPTTIAGIAATIYRVPPEGEGGGEFGGHVVVEWTQAGATFQMSLHGYGNLGRAEVMAEAVMREVHVCAVQPLPRACRGRVFPSPSG